MDAQTSEPTYETRGATVIIHRLGFRPVELTREKCVATIRLIKSRRLDYISETSYLHNLEIFEQALKLFGD